MNIRKPFYWLTKGPCQVACEILYPFCFVFFTITLFNSIHLYIMYPTIYIYIYSPPPRTRVSRSLGRQQWPRFQSLKHTHTHTRARIPINTHKDTTAAEVLRPQLETYCTILLLLFSPKQIIVVQRCSRDIYRVNEKFRLHERIAVDTYLNGFFFLQEREIDRTVINNTKHTIAITQSINDGMRLDVGNRGI
jgi:hypothetical protein